MFEDLRRLVMIVMSVTEGALPLVPTETRLPARKTNQAKPLAKKTFVMSPRKRATHKSHGASNPLDGDTTAALPLTPKNMKVSELREALTAQGLSPKGLKKDLVERLEAHLLQPSTLATAPRGKRSKLSAQVSDDSGTEEDTKAEEPQASASPAKSPSNARKSRRTQSVEPVDPVTEDSQEQQIMPEPELDPTSQPAESQAKIDKPSPPPSPLPEQALPPPSPLPEKAPPPPKDASRVVSIGNFVRPFAVPAVRDLVSQFGVVEDFWMDAMRTRCFVTFERADAAEDCQARLAGLKWPPETGRCLQTRYSTTEEASREKEAEANRAKAPVVDREKEPPALDQLFMKTITTPCLYYLPAQRVTDHQRTNI